MKNLMLVLVLLAAINLSGQNYYVISIVGEIYAGEKMLSPKDRLSHDTQLRFVGAEASAYLMSPSKGYFVLSAKEIYPEGGKEFLVAVKNALLPPSELKNTAIRAGFNADEHVTIEDHYDLLGFFRGTIAYLDTLVFELNEEFLPGEETRIEWVSTNGSDTLRRDLTLDGQRFIMVWPQELAEANANWEHQIICHPWYVEDEQEPYSFQIATPAPEELRSELAALREITEVESDAAFVAEYATPYVIMRYGKVHPGHLKGLVGE